MATPQAQPVKLERDFRTPLRDWAAECRDKINARSRAVDQKLGEIDARLANLEEQQQSASARLDELMRRLDTQPQTVPSELDPVASPKIDGLDKRLAALEAREMPTVDNEAIVTGLVAAIKTDTELQTLLRGPRGYQGIAGDSPPPATRVTHATVIANRNASYWPRLEEQIQRAQEHFSPIRVIDPPPFATRLPGIVFYVAPGTPIYEQYGERDVSRTLTDIQRGNLTFLQES